jgi:hypothetical protein
VGLRVEGVVDGGVGREESLSLTLGLEPLHFSLPAPDRKVRILGTIVGAHAAWPVAVGEAEVPRGGPVRRQLVRGDGFGVDALVLEQFSEQFQRRMFVPSALDQHVQHLALVIDRAPQEHLPPADPHHHLIEMPSTRWRRPTPAQVGRDQRTELQRPAADRLVADLDPALGQQLLDVPQAQGEAEIQPHRIADHVRRELMTLERDRTHEPSPAQAAPWAQTGEKLASA